MNAEHEEDVVELDEHAPPPAARPSKLASWINKKTLLSVLAGILMAVVTSWVKKRHDQLGEGGCGAALSLRGCNLVERSTIHVNSFGFSSINPYPYPYPNLLRYP